MTDEDMTPERALQLLEETVGAVLADRRAAHAVADATLMFVLDALGYSELVEAYKKIPKGYA